MTSKVLEGHIKPLEIFLDIYFFYIIFLLKLHVNANIMKTQVFHEIKHDLKGHERSHKALDSFLSTDFDKKKKQFLT